VKPIDFFILGAILGLYLFYKISRYYQHKKRQLILYKAKRAENSAVKILQSAGYKIVDVQKRVKVKTKIDGKDYYNTIIADMIVKKGGKNFLVEIKTGKQTERPVAPQIRRQLLEYFLVFKPDGIILLDMEVGKLHYVSFDLGNNYNYKAYLGYILAFLIGAFLAWLYLSFKY